MCLANSGPGANGWPLHSESRRRVVGFFALIPALS